MERNVLYNLDQFILSDPCAYSECSAVKNIDLFLYKVLDFIKSGSVQRPAWLDLTPMWKAKTGQAMTSSSCLNTLRSISRVSPMCSPSIFSKTSS